jgi:hypothetical protein
MQKINPLVISRYFLQFNDTDPAVVPDFRQEGSHIAIGVAAIKTCYSFEGTIPYAFLKTNEK